MENDRRLEQIRTVMEMYPHSKEYKVLFEDRSVDWVLWLMHILRSELSVLKIPSTLKSVPLKVQLGCTQLG